MRFNSFLKNGAPAVGVRSGDDIVDLGALAPELPNSLLALLQGGPEAMQTVATALAPPVPM
jgi:hypothetical protein